MQLSASKAADAIKIVTKNVCEIIYSENPVQLKALFLRAPELRILFFSNVKS